MLHNSCCDKARGRGNSTKQATREAVFIGGAIITACTRCIVDTMQLTRRLSELHDLLHCIALFRKNKLRGVNVPARCHTYLGIPDLHAKVSNRPGNNLSCHGCLVLEKDILHHAADDCHRPREQHAHVKSSARTQSQSASTAGFMHIPGTFGPNVHTSRSVRRVVAMHFVCTYLVLRICSYDRQHHCCRVLCL